MDADILTAIGFVQCSRLWSAGSHQEALNARDQAAGALHSAVEREQPLAVGGDVEAVDLPGRDSKVHHNGADVSEKTWAYGFALVSCCVKPSLSVVVLVVIVVHCHPYGVSGVRMIGPLGMTSD
jgi:hypothetical protein